MNAFADTSLAAINSLWRSSNCLNLSGKRTVPVCLSNDVAYGDLNFSIRRRNFRQSSRPDTYLDGDSVRLTSS